MNNRVSGRTSANEPTPSMDPVPLEHYTPAEIEFMHAMQEYKRHHGRMFPTWREVLEVLTSLGYARPETEADAA